MIDFEVKKEKVLKKNLEVYPVLYFNQVIQLNPYTVLYDLNDAPQRDETCIKSV